MLDPRKPISEYPLVPRPEQNQLVAAWSGAYSDYPTESSVPELFGDIARARPDAIAVESGSKRVTYGQLDRWSSRLASMLFRNGVRQTDIVAISAECSPASTAGLLGILKAGATYLAVEPNLPAQRITFMLEDAAAKFCLLQDGSPVREFVSQVTSIGFSPDIHDVAGLPDHAPDLVSGPESTAYIVFSSGSTGRPKGVCALHREGGPACERRKLRRMIERQTNSIPPELIPSSETDQDLRAANHNS